MKTITAVLLLMACAAQAQTKDPTYTREPVTQMVPHCAVGYHLEQYTPAEYAILPIGGMSVPAITYPAQEKPEHWDVVDPASIPELHDQTKYRCSAVNGAAITLPEDGPIYGGTLTPGGVGAANIYMDSSTALTMPQSAIFGPVTLDLRTGIVTIQPGVTLDEASKQFWDAVEKDAGRQQGSCVAGVQQHDSCVATLETAEQQSEAACSATLKAANDRTLKLSKLSLEAVDRLDRCNATLDAVRKIAQDAARNAQKLTEKK